MDKVKISVRRLVEFILRAGDLDSGSQSLRDPSVMQEGSAIHKKIQKEGGASYRPEVSMKMDFAMDNDLTVTLEGRADGIIEDIHIPVDENDSGCFYTIDEIKGTYASLRRMEEPSPVHMGQALCYAYMYAKSENLSKIGVQVTYVHMESGKIRRFTQERTFEQLHTWMMDVLEKYALWVRWALDWKARRNISIGGQNFPFEYRPDKEGSLPAFTRPLFRGKNCLFRHLQGRERPYPPFFPQLRLWGREKRQNFLSHGQNHHPDCGGRHLSHAG